MVSTNFSLPPSLKLNVNLSAPIKMQNTSGYNPSIKHVPVSDIVSLRFGAKRKKADKEEDKEPVQQKSAKKVKVDVQAGDSSAKKVTPAKQSTRRLSVDSHDLVGMRFEDAMVDHNDKNGEMVSWLTELVNSRLDKTSPDYSKPDLEAHLEEHY